MKKIVLALALIGIVMITSVSFAYAEDIDAQINELQAQIDELQAQMDALKAQKAQNEAGGGSSDSLYVETDRVFDVYDSYGDTRFEAIIEITNVSTEPLYLTDGVFDLEDSEGHLLQTDDMISTAPTVVKPGEKGYFYNQFGADIETDVDINSIQFVPQYKVIKANKTPHEYPISDVSLKEDQWGGMGLVGRILNDTDEEDVYVYVRAMFYNSEGKIIGITGTNVSGMTPGQNTSFSISSMFAQNMMSQNEIADYKVIAQETYYQW